MAQAKDTIEELALGAMYRLLDQPAFHELASTAVSLEEITREEFFEQTARAIRTACEVAFYGSKREAASFHPSASDDAAPASPSASGEAQ